MTTTPRLLSDSLIYAATQSQQAAALALVAAGLTKHNLVNNSASSILSAQSVYGVNTAVGALILTLPPIVNLDQGSWIEIYDIDYNANVNNITIRGSGNDNISLYGVSAPNQVITIAGMKAKFVVNGTKWSMVV